MEKPFYVEKKKVIAVVQAFRKRIDAVHNKPQVYEDGHRRVEDKCVDYAVLMIRALEGKLQHLNHPPELREKK